ncbi:MAG TPA: restriction endonuclease, partial [Pseudoxanthomonas sp.]
MGAAATAYLWLIRRRDDETAAGLLALAGMRWKDFSRLVLDAMHHRGLSKMTVEKDDPQEQSSSFVLSRDSQRWLLACKHGSAYRIGTAAIDELAAEIRLLGAVGGILVTQGILDKSGREKAGKNNIEVLDGNQLWPEVKSTVDGNLRNRIVGNAAARARRHIGIAWLGAVTLGVASALAFPSAAPDRDNAAVALTKARPAAEATEQPASASTATPEPSSVQREPTEAELDQQRAAISKALSNTTGISRGVWITRSTLSVDRLVSEQ